LACENYSQLNPFTIMCTTIIMATIVIYVRGYSLVTTTLIQAFISYKY